MTAARVLGPLCLLPSLLCGSPATGSAPGLTYDNTPLGTLAKPLLLRTFFPDPDLDPAVFAHHHRGAPSPKYSVAAGRDVNGEYQPVKGIAAAIGVNHGPALSYCFDTTECRLLYAWQGGFLDMFPYWGDRQLGTRQAFNYVPHLVGNLFFKTAGKHPVHLNGKSLSDLGAAPDFLGYTLKDGSPHFRYQAGEHTITIAIAPGVGHEFHLSLASEPAADLDYRPAGADVTRDQQASPPRFTVRGTLLATYQGFPRDLGVTAADPASGERLYLSYGCIACHSTDGSPGHGPSFGGLFGRTRPLEGDQEVLADEAYLLASIKTPNAHVAKGFPPNYMPPYQLKEIEYQALLAFLKNLGRPE